jgi:hypothetical protein
VHRLAYSRDVVRRSPDQLAVSRPERSAAIWIITVEQVRRPPTHQHKEAVQISSLKGDQISAQRFNPGLRNSRDVPEGAPQSDAAYRIEIIYERLLILAPLSGRIFGWRVPRVETG